MPSVRSRYKWIVPAAAVFAAGAASAGLTWSSHKQNEKLASALTGGDPTRAPEIMRRYGCAGCHTIPGVPGADGLVGPALSGLGQRVYIAGVATNSPDNLIRWIVTPQAFSPRTAMPPTGISEAEAREVAAYLYAQ
jgi:mono/diheme cytochrome c family protein